MDKSNIGFAQAIDLCLYKSVNISEAFIALFVFFNVINGNHIFTEVRDPVMSQNFFKCSAFFWIFNQDTLNKFFGFILFN